MRIVSAEFVNRDTADQPLRWHYVLESAGYAKLNGGFMLLRPRILGSDAAGFLETRTPRINPIEFDGPLRNSDEFEVELPAGFALDEQPPPISVEDGFASYHSEVAVTGRVLRYRRSFEIRALTVPVERAEELKALYRVITADERQTLLLTQVSK